MAFTMEKFSPLNREMAQAVRQFTTARTKEEKEAALKRVESITKRADKIAEK